MIVKPTGGPLGAFVTGVDVRELKALGGLDTALKEQMLLIFRDQELSVDQLLRFAQLWGEPIAQPPVFTPLPGQPFVTRVRSHLGRGWHVDGGAWSTGATTLVATLLHSPSGGGATDFSRTADRASIYKITWEPNTLAVWGPVQHKRSGLSPQRVAHRVVVR